MTLVHIAGPDIQVNQYLRQRCAWCGTSLIEYDLARTAVPIGTDPRPATWPIGSHVAVEGGASYTVDVNSCKVPADSCTRLDPEVTS